MAKFQDKERVLKAAREKKEVTYRGDPIRLATDFLMETLQAKRDWQGIFQVMKTKAGNHDYCIRQDFQLNGRPNKELP